MLRVQKYRSIYMKQDGRLRTASWHALSRGEWLLLVLLHELLRKSGVCSEMR